MRFTTLACAAAMAAAGGLASNTIAAPVFDVQQVKTAACAPYSHLSENEQVALAGPAVRFAEAANSYASTPILERDHARLAELLSQAASLTVTESKLSTAFVSSLSDEELSGALEGIYSLIDQRANPSNLSSGLFLLLDAMESRPAFLSLAGRIAFERAKFHLSLNEDTQHAQALLLEATLAQWEGSSRASGWYQLLAGEANAESIQYAQEFEEWIELTNSPIALTNACAAIDHARNSEAYVALKSSRSDQIAVQDFLEVAARVGMIRNMPETISWAKLEASSLGQDSGDLMAEIVFYEAQYNARQNRNAEAIAATELALAMPLDPAIKIDIMFFRANTFKVMVEHGKAAQEYMSILASFPEDPRSQDAEKRLYILVNAGMILDPTIFSAASATLAKGPAISSK